MTAFRQLYEKKGGGNKAKSKTRVPVFADSAYHSDDAESSLFFTAIL